MSSKDKGFTNYISIPQKAVTEDAVLVTHDHFHYMGHKKGWYGTFDNRFNL